MINYIKKYNRLSLLVLAAFLISSCSTKEVERKKSFSDGDFEEKIEKVLDPQDSERVATLTRLVDDTEKTLAPYSKKPMTAEDAKKMVKDIIYPLKKMVLNKNFILDPDDFYIKSASDRALVPRLVSLFNRALILVNEASPALVKNLGLLQEYKELILWDCDENLKGSCLMIKNYKRIDSSGIIKIIKMIHKYEQDSQEKLRLIYAAFDMKGRRVDPELRYMLFERLIESFEKEKKGGVDPARLKQDADLFANTLKINIQNVGKDKRYALLFKKIQVWQSLSRHGNAALGPSMSDIIRLAAKGIYQQNGQLESDLMSVVESLKYKVGPKYEQGVLFQEKNIQGLWQKKFSTKQVADLSEDQKQKLQKSLSPEEQLVLEKVRQYPEAILYGDESQKIMEHLIPEGTLNFAWDEYLFLTHQLYYGHFNVDDAASFWEGTGKDKVRLLDEFSNIIKLQIVNNIVYSNTVMNHFYKENKSIGLIDLLEESEREASKVRKTWNEIDRRSVILRGFATRVSSTKDPVIAQKLNKLVRDVSALSKNIKFLVTYPNMFPLMYVMASQELEAKVESYFGSYDIASETVIDRFFAGTFIPWFNFGHDGNELDKTQIIYSFYYALVTQIFEVYSKNPVQPLQSADSNDFFDDFFKVVFRKLVNETEGKLTEALTELRASQSTLADKYQTMLGICQEEKNLRPLDESTLQEMQLNPGFDMARDFSKSLKKRRKVNNQMSFKYLDTFVYEPMNLNAGRVGSYLKSLSAVEIGQTLKSIREDFAKSTATAEILMTVYSEVSKKSKEDIQKISEEQFSNLRRLQATYLQTIYDLEMDTQGCEWSVYKRDRDIKHTIIFREIESLRSLFEKIYPLLHDKSEDELNAEDGSLQNQLEEIRKNHFAEFTSEESYPQSYKDNSGHAYISPKFLVTMKMDSLAKVLYYIKSDPHLRGAYKISMPDDYSTLDIYKKNNKAGFNFDWRGSKDEAKERFVAAGLSVFANHIGWIKNPPTLVHYVQKGKVLTNLYKMGRFSIDPLVDCDDPKLSDVEKKQACRKLTASHLINYFREYINIVNIDERDRLVFDYIGIKKKYKIKDYDKLIKVEKEDRLYSLYDLVYKRVFSDSKTVTETQTSWFSGTIISYVDSVHSKNGSTFIFESPDFIAKIFEEKYRNWLVKFFEMNKDFISAIKKDIDENNVKPFNFSYVVGRSHSVASGGRGALSPLVSDVMYGRFLGFADEMNTNTGGYFSKTFNHYKKEFRQIVGQEVQAVVDEELKESLKEAAERDAHGGGEEEASVDSGGS